MRDAGTCLYKKNPYHPGSERTICLSYFISCLGWALPFQRMMDRRRLKRQIMFSYVIHINRRLSMLSRIQRQGFQDGVFYAGRP